MKITYGIDVQESDDPYILLTEESLSGLEHAAIPGAFWVDFFPILKYVPSWIPGAGFQKKAAIWREVNASMSQKPFCHVKELLVGRLFFFEIVWLILNDDSAEQWHTGSWAILSSNPHRASSQWGWSPTAHGGKTCARCGCQCLCRSVVTLIYSRWTAY